MIDFVAVDLDQIVSSSALSIPNPGSITFWVELTGLTGWDYVFSIEDNFEIRFDNFDDTFQTILYRASGSPTLSNTTFSTGNVYNIGCNWEADGGANYFNRIYVNGALDKSESNSKGNVTNGNVYIGSKHNNAGYIDALIGDFRVYNRILSAEEFSTIYAMQGKDGIRQGLQHQWVMNERGKGDAVSSVIDRVAALNLATGTGSPVYGESGFSARRKVADV